MTPFSKLWATAEVKSENYFKMTSYLNKQYTKKASKTRHLRHGQDQTDLHAAELVVPSDSGATAVL